MASEANDGTDDLTLRLPAPFAEAIEATLEAGCRFEATLMLYGRDLSLAFDRSVLGHVALP
jgi:hypothetical protein